MATNLPKQLKQTISKLVKSAETDYKSIFDRLFYLQEEEDVGLISQDTVKTLFDRVWIPNRLSWENGWVDSESDQNNTSYKGITYGFFKDNFDQLFKNLDGYTELESVGWRLNRTIGLGLFKEMLRSEAVVKLYMATAYTNKSLGKCNLISTSDPWLSFQFAGLFLSFGSSFYDSLIKNVLANDGFNGNLSNISQYINSRQIKDVVSLSSKIFVASVNKANIITKQGSKLSSSRKLILSDFIFGDDHRDSRLDLLIKINIALRELKSKKSLTAEEEDYVARLNDQYRLVNFTFEL